MERVALQAGRLMMERIRELSDKRQDFGFETTLSGRSYLKLFRSLKKQGYTLQLYYLWVPHVELVLQRVVDRIKSGGHSVPPEDVKRRFHRSLHNLFFEYAPLFDSIHIFDNSERKPTLVFSQDKQQMIVHEAITYEKIRKNVES
jgi:predicted ABC-type ATPase